MIIELFALLFSALAWVAILWLAIAPDFAKWTNPGIIALHALPPLATWLVWVILRRRAQKKKNAEAQLREEKAQAERDAIRNTAQQKHEEEMRLRRFGCDCRIVTMTDLGVLSETPFITSAVPNVEIQSLVLEKPEEPFTESVLDRMVPALTNALATIYSACRAAVVFPIYLLPPSDVSGEEVLTRVRAIHTELMNTLVPPAKPGANVPSILFLPASDSAPNSIISLFEVTPDLPAAIVLAFDSPFSRAASSEVLGDEPNPEQTKREQQIGKPSEGVIALFLTNPELPSMLTAIASIEDDSEHDSMTPFWQKAVHPEGNLALLTRTSQLSRDQLTQLPVLGRVHRAASKQADQQRAGVLEMTRMVQNLLERAQINAELIDIPFAFADAAPTPPDEASDKEAPATPCRRIVHNAGGVDVAGKRIGALGAALYYFNIDLNPVDIETATNIVTRIGDLGRATGIGQLALSIAHAAEHVAPVLCAEFSDQDAVAVSFVMPAPAKA